MPKVQPTTTITIDGAVFAVDSMSNNVKEMIALMDEWRQRDADLVTEIAMVRGALRDIQNNIYVAINKQREEAAQKEAAEDAEGDSKFVEVGSDEPTEE